MSKKIDKLKNALHLDSFSLKNEEVLRDRKGCPAPEEILQSFSPEAPLELKKKIIDHITECPACRSEFELIMGSQELAARAEKLVSGKNLPLLKIRSLGLFLGHYWKLAAVLSVLAAVIVILFYQASPWAFFHPERSTSHSLMFRMKENISYQPLKISLSWEPIPEALFYRVELFNENMRLIWQSPPLNQPLAEIPPELINQNCSPYFYWHFLTYTSEKKPLESPVRKIKLPVQ
ncbi:MAG: hypothetical protein H5U07_10880 [Candidatus Aminicenantes bacterium]|nr:hypothetical protein [Candidatus Aminicenantes bacterium]